MVKKRKKIAVVKYVCMFCGRRMHSFASLNAHISGHINERPEPCVQCDIWFRSSQELWHHRKTVHEGITFTCEFCNKRFEHAGSLSTHRSQVHSKQFYQQIKRRRLKKRRIGTASRIKITTSRVGPGTSRVARDKTEKEPRLNTETSNEAVENTAKEEEEISEESDEEPLYPHQRSNHEEYFNAIDKQKSAALVAIFKAFPLVKLKGDRLQVPSFIPLRVPVESLEKTKTPSYQHVKQEDNKVTVKNPASTRSQLFPSCRPTECTICGKYISRRSNLVKHVRIIHGVDLPPLKPGRKLRQSPSPPPRTSKNYYKCYKCSSRFSHLSILRRHMSTLHPGCPLKVISTTPGGGQGRIPETSVTSVNEESHRQRSTRKEDPCQKCGEVFPTTKRLLSHWKSNPNCDQKEFSRALQEPEQDNLSHTLATSERLKCPVCSSSWTDKNALQKHVHKAHRKLKSKIDKLLQKIVYKCSKCSAKLSRPDALRRHMKLMHRKSPMKILPSQQVSSTKQKLKTEKTSKSAFKCSQCNIIFKWERNLDRHVRNVHSSSGTGEVLSKSPVEPTGQDLENMAASVKVFKNDSKEKGGGPTEGPILATISTNGASPGSLFEKKLLNVTSTNPVRSENYQCENCGCWFLSMFSLERHKNHNSCVYAKEKALKKLDASLDFICNFCNKQFEDIKTARYSLEIHLAKTHRFQHENGRKYRHLKKTRAPEVYFCPFCGCMETAPGGITAHLRKSHRELLGVPKKTV